MRFALSEPAMSSDTLASVEALIPKAQELAQKGHLLRAAEKYGRAAEVACALGADNLVALHMQLRQRAMLGGHVVASPDDSADQRIRAAECNALLSGVLEALERRRVAGTLLAGRCTAAEEAWRGHELQRDNPRFTAAQVADWASLVGYEEVLHGATNASSSLLHARRLLITECSAEQLQSFAENVVHAAELMQQPRRHAHQGLQFEAEFTDAFHSVVMSTRTGLDARLMQLLAGAWQRLLRSGVLEARGVDEGIRARATWQRALDSAVGKSLNAPGLRCCALPGCGAKEAHPAHFKSCAACRTVVYCCREHQVAGWPAHKKACKAARKAQEDGGAGPSSA